MEQSFGAVLSRLRRSKELSQRALAKELFISQALLCQYENGTREPGLPFIDRVCDFFGVSADYLLGRSAHKSEGVSLPALSRFSAALDLADDPDLTRIAEAYVSAAAERVCTHISGEGEPAEQALKMAEAELLLLRSLQKHSTKSHQNPDTGDKV